MAISASSHVAKRPSCHFTRVASVRYGFGYQHLSTGDLTVHGVVPRGDCRHVVIRRPPRPSAVPSRASACVEPLRFNQGRRNAVRFLCGQQALRRHCLMIRRLLFGGTCSDVTGQNADVLERESAATTASSVPSSNRPSVTKSDSRGRPFAQPRELFADCRDQRQRRGDFMLRTPVAAEDTFNIRQRHARERVSGARL